MTDLRCCMLVRKGRFLTATSYFEPGESLTVVQPKRHGSDAGRLAIVAATRRSARVVEVLGPERDLSAVMRGLLAERGMLDYSGGDGAAGDMPHDVEHHVQSLPDEIPHLGTRKDLRSQLCVTIDPPDAKDHDDAVALERTPELDASGGVALWVHIADVSAYVRPGSPLDEYAASRGVSVYVPGQVEPMLPHRLSSDLCSLRPGVDRGCVSVRLELDGDGEVVKTSFARTLIRSSRRLSYDQVDDLLEQGTSIDPVIDELLTDIDRVTEQLRQRRLRAGALDLHMPEVVFELGESQHAGETVALGALGAFESRSHRLVEECMLLANLAVGERLAQADRPAIYRVHEEPDPASVLLLLSQFERLGVPTPPVPDDLSPRQAARLAGEAVKLAHRYSEQSGRGRHAFAPRVLRSLKQARYDQRPGRHSGLAMSNYLHFTSPIRRYPDLVNHRSLLSLIGAGSDEACEWPLEEVAQFVSDVEREAAVVERDADDIVKAHLLHQQLSHGIEPEADGEVVGLIGAGAFLRFDEVYEGFLPARTLGSGERYELDEHGLGLVGTRSGDRLQLGDVVRVQVVRVDRAQGKVDLRRVVDR